MNIPCVQQFICRHYEVRRQQGVISLVALVLLVVMVFMGRGLVYFQQQGAINSYSYRQEMQLRLAAESMVEKQWLSLQNDDSRLQDLQPGTTLLLDKGSHEGVDYTVFAREWGGKVYLIATTFRRNTAIEKIIEPHVMVKGVLAKEGEHYAWRGWAP